MPEAAEVYIPPTTRVESAKQGEIIKNQHFNYTLVFGQGPVQEVNKVPQTGREGLNFYSRLEAKAAAEMLKNGITDKLILSGGKTGARAQTNEGKTEAELMMDLIKTDLGIDKEGNFHNSKGQLIKFSETVLIENLSKDTLENFVQIVNKFIDQDGFGKAKMALLGISFHAHSTNQLGVGGADIGRLEALSSIFKLNAPVYSAEEVLRELVVGTHDEDSAIGSIMGRLTKLSESSNVTLLKAQQEGVLVDMLKHGDWLRVLDLFKNETRIKFALSSQSETLKELGFSKKELENADINDVKKRVKDFFVSKIQPTQTLYSQTKPIVFDALKSMGTVNNGIRDVNIMDTYGKGELPKQN